MHEHKDPGRIFESRTEDETRTAGPGYVSYPVQGSILRTTERCCRLPAGSAPSGSGQGSRRAGGPMVNCWPL